MSIPPTVISIVQYIASGNARAFMFGGGLAYAVSNGFWHHTPLILLNPFAYTSYQLYVSKTDLIKWCKQTLV